jgi:hypothetical protein
MNSLFKQTTYVSRDLKVSPNIYKRSKTFKNNEIVFQPLLLQSYQQISFNQVTSYSGKKKYNTETNLAKSVGVLKFLS